ncbi:hypothetical protein [Haloferula sp. BvORR071]|uniref:hypothetical protein n=1 Tax=Haloferula sp. BvORR071 TaxID=1396141 RepID=UPI0005515C9B|nr:hypothetical protein [Haloferula sp. BvORR071]
MRKIGIPALCVLLGCTGGYFLGSAGKTAAEANGSKAPASSRTESREARGTDRIIPPATSLEDLKALLKTGRSRITEARVTLALENVPPQQLSSLATEMREYYRTHPGYDFVQTQLLGSVMGAWADRDPDAALAFVRDSPSKIFRNMADDSIFRVLAEANPEDAIARAKQLSSPAERLNALGAAAWAMVKKDPREGLRLFGDIKELPGHMRMLMLEQVANTSPEEAVAALAKVSPTERDNFWNSEGVFTAWAANDPEAVLKWAETATDLDMKNSALRAACRRMASDDPAAALAKIDGMPAHLRGQLIGGVMATWADRDFNGALAAAGAMSKPAEREQAMAAIVDRMDWSDPGQTSKVVLAMPKGNARTSALENLSYSLRWQSPSEADAVLAQFEGVEHSILAGSLAGTMVADDPEGAIKLFNSIPSTLRDEDKLQTFVWSLARHDPEKALEFATSLSSANERSQAVRQAIQQMAVLSPQDAVKQLSSFKDANDRQQAMVALAETWGSNDPEAALKWAESLSGDEQTTALAKLLPARAKNDPAEASARLQSLLENPGSASGSALQSATADLATEWAGRDPQQTAAWVGRLPAGTAAESGATALVTNWSSHDPAAAANWIASLPDGGVKDAAIQPLVGAILQNDPDNAFSWGLSIQDPTKRAEVMAGTIRQWNTNDGEAVRVAIQRADLNDEERATYEKLLH